MGVSSVVIEVCTGKKKAYKKRGHYKVREELCGEPAMVAEQSEVPNRRHRERWRFSNYDVTRTRIQFAQVLRNRFYQTEGDRRFEAESGDKWCGGQNRRVQTRMSLHICVGNTRQIARRRRLHQ